MAISGWFVLLVAFGIVPIVVTGEPVVFLLWIGFAVFTAWRIPQVEEPEPAAEI